MVLFDEPTSVLDPERVSEILQVIESWRKRGSPDADCKPTRYGGFAFTISDRVAFMGIGRIKLMRRRKKFAVMRNHRILRFIDDMATA
ncbi:hypothetical protein ACVXG7_25650 [Enterobacter hormaechei]